MVTEHVSDAVQTDRLSACNVCDKRAQINPLPGVSGDGCTMCMCLIETLTKSKRHPELLEGKLSMKMVQTKCKHPGGSKWIVAIAMLLMSFTGFAQWDTDYFPERDTITDADSLKFWNRTGDYQYRYTTKAVVELMRDSILGDSVRIDALGNILIGVNNDTVATQQWVQNYLQSLNLQTVDFTTLYYDDAAAGAGGVQLLQRYALAKINAYGDQEYTVRTRTN